MSLHARSLPLPTVLGIALASGFITGSATLSYLAVPSVIFPEPEPEPNATRRAGSGLPASATSAPQMARQWRDMFDKGKKAGPFVTVVAASLWIYMARMFPAQSSARTFHYVAAALAVSIVPFTFIFMGRTNNELLRRAKAGDVGKDVGEDKLLVDRASSIEEFPTEDLMWRWAKLNMTRSLLSLAAIGCAIYGSL